MTITEPVTMLTDYALAGISLFFSARLFREGRLHRQTSVLLWAAALAVTASASICGGSYHGFVAHLSDLTRFALWKATVYSLGLMSLLMLSSVIVAAVRRPLRDWLLAASALDFVVYAAWMTTHNDFRYVIYDYAPAMVGVLLLQVWAVYRRSNASAFWIVAGVLVSFVAAGVQQSGFNLHENFNHNDLYHVIQLVALYLFYRGGLLLQDQR